MAARQVLQTTVLLADFVQEVGGKLYINGGGWTKILIPNEPVQMGIAVKIRGRGQVQKERLFHIDLVDSRRRPVKLKPPDGGRARAVKIEGKMVPRPDATGGDVDAALATNIILTLAPGRYEWRVFVENRITGRWPFEVVEQPE